MTAVVCTGARKWPKFGLWNRNLKHTHTQLFKKQTPAVVSLAPIMQAEVPYVAMGSAFRIPLRRFFASVM